MGLWGFRAFGVLWFGFGFGVVGYGLKVSGFPISGLGTLPKSWG